MAIVGSSLARPRARFDLCAEELAGLCRWLLIAIDSACIPEWEFDSLVGCSRAEARAWVEAGVPGADLDERLLDQVVTMLSMLRGAGYAGVPGHVQVEQLLEKLFWSSDGERSARADPQSSVGLSSLSRPRASFDRPEVELPGAAGPAALDAAPATLAPAPASSRPRFDGQARAAAHARKRRAAAR